MRRPGRRLSLALAGTAAALCLIAFAVALQWKQEPSLFRRAGWTVVVTWPRGVLIALAILVGALMALGWFTKPSGHGRHTFVLLYYAIPHALLGFHLGVQRTMVQAHFEPSELSVARLTSNTLLYVLAWSAYGWWCGLRVWNRRGN